MTGIGCNKSKERVSVISLILIGNVTILFGVVSYNTM